MTYSQFMQRHTQLSSALRALTSRTNTKAGIRNMASNEQRAGKAPGRLQGRVYLVTGSTDGIGKHTAKQLLLDGATVIIHGRQPLRVADTVAELSRVKGGGRVAAYTRDLSSIAEVKGLASDVKRDFERVDVLVNNAGVFMNDERMSVDGYEYTWAVNVLAPYVLTHGLLGVVTSRIVNVSSISASRRIDWDNLNQEKGFSAHNAYGLSKLAAQMFTYELAARVRQAGLTVNTLDPGTVNTKMLLDGWGPCGIEIEDANDELWLSTSPDLEDVSGQYFVSGRPSSPGAPALDAAARRKLFEILEVQSGVKYPASI